MTDIPAGWPPEDETQALSAPLFPLPGVVLYPGHVMPLHIFEPRYREMINDLLDGQGRLVMGNAQPQDDDQPPQVHSVAGLGEIGRHEQLPDGRYFIWLIGLARVRVIEAESDRSYRRVSFEILHEIPPPQEREEELQESLRTAILARSEDLLNLPEEIPSGHLTDLLLQRLTLDPERRQAMFEMLSVVDRAEAALAAHEASPPTESEDE